MDKPAKEIPLDEALKVFKDWRERSCTIVVVIGSEEGWGATADGIVNQVLTSPGQDGIEFWSLTEGQLRRIDFANVTFFRLFDLEGAPKSLRIGWYSFLLAKFPDVRRLLFAERRCD